MEIAGNKSLFNNYMTASDSNSSSSVKTQTNPFAVQSNSGVQSTGDIFEKTMTSSSLKTDSLTNYKFVKAMTWGCNMAMAQTMPTDTLHFSNLKTECSKLNKQFFMDIKAADSDLFKLTKDSSVSQEDFDKQYEKINQKYSSEFDVINLKLQIFYKLDKAMAPVKESGELDSETSGIMDAAISSIANGKLDLANAKDSDEASKMKKDFLKQITDPINKKIKDKESKVSDSGSDKQVNLCNKIIDCINVSQ